MWQNENSVWAMQILFGFLALPLQFFFICTGNAILFYFLHGQCKLFLVFAWSMQIIFILCVDNAALFNFWHWECNSFFIFFLGNANSFYFLHGHTVLKQSGDSIYCKTIARS